MTKFTAPPMTPEQMYNQEERKRSSDENEIRLGRVEIQVREMGSKRFENSRQKHRI